MQTLEDHLAHYAGYHRDPRNIATHFIGIPLIVLALEVLLSRPAVSVAGLPCSPALLASLLACLYYLRLQTALGLLMSLLLGLALWLGSRVAALPTAEWLGWGGGGFVLGWAFQFAGHVWEGRKPAFVDDIRGLIIGPLFVVAEALFLLGCCKTLQQAIEARSGPVRRRPA